MITPIFAAQTTGSITGGRLGAIHRRRVINLAGWTVAMAET